MNNTASTTELLETVVLSEVTQWINAATANRTANNCTVTGERLLASQDAIDADNSSGPSSSTGAHQRTSVNCSSLAAAVLASMDQRHVIRDSFGSTLQQNGEWDANMVAVLSFVVWIGASVFIIFGGAIPFLFQYFEFKNRKTAKGFSLMVCLTLLVANILRILFWFGKRFELQLLFQSIVMIGCMLTMIHMAVTTNRKQMLPPHKTITIWDGDFVENFWAWTDFGSYCLAMGCFSGVASLITLLYIQSGLFVEVLGFCALFIEANLGVGQIYRNWKRRSTVGMSVRMVLTWLIGDIGKTIYFLARNTPNQFWLCGLFQITVDLLILAQVGIYRYHGSERFEIVHS